MRLELIFAALALTATPLGCGGRRDAAPTATRGAPKDEVSLRPDQATHLEVVEAKADIKGAALRTTGRVTYDEDRVARVAAPVSGRVGALRVRAGDAVKAGQVLAVIHSPDVAAAAADLAQDRAARVLAEHNVARAERLLASGAGTQREVDEARTALKSSHAAEDRDAARLRLLGGASESSATYELRAPIAGTVTERNATLGGGVRSDDPQPLFVIGDLEHVWVLVDVFEQDVALVKRGGTAEVVVPAYPDRVFLGAVEQTGSTLDATSRTIKVRIAMDNADRALLPEMFARVTLRAAGRPVVCAPAGAILTRGDKTLLFVQQGDKFVRREVVLGSRFDGQVQILSGLEAGERVVARGGLLLDAELHQRL